MWRRAKWAESQLKMIRSQFVCFEMLLSLEDWTTLIWDSSLCQILIHLEMPAKLFQLNDLLHNPLKGLRLANGWKRTLRWFCRTPGSNLVWVGLHPNICTLACCLIGPSSKTGFEQTQNKKIQFIATPGRPWVGLQGTMHPKAAYWPIIAV